MNSLNLRHMLQRAPAKPHDQDRTEVRLLAWFVTGGFIWTCLKSAYYLALVPSAALAKVGRVATVPEWLISGIFIVAAIMAIPHFASLTCLPNKLHCQLPRQLAAVAAFACAGTWFVLSAIAFDKLSLAWSPFIYLGNSIGSLAIACIYGFSVNAQQLRERIDDAEEDN